MTPDEAREAVRKILDAVSALHEGDNDRMNRALAGIDGETFVVTALTLVEVTISAVAVGTRSEFSGALAEVRSQVLARLADDE